MSSANEHLAPPPKPRMSPLDFRNTDLVSRLLAATPPYLYNMSLLPNTYFFSEMLRSFVQAKNDTSSRSIPGSLHQRRTRKRPWTSTRPETYHQKPPTPPKCEQQSNDWHLKNSKPIESPLELTTRPTLMDSLSSDKISPNKIELDKKNDISLHDHQIYSAHSSQDSGLILPPPPPIWYPPLYPTAPYGIDPLHFFIDLRVSGHIYDRKNQKEPSSTETSSSCLLNDNKSHVDDENITQNRLFGNDSFKQSRHASAFSVPTPHMSKTSPINLSQEVETKNIKFDVKSMGFEKPSNKNGTNYIMCNIANIYKNINDNKDAINQEIDDNESEEQRQKRVKDLRALIGLELVVDYMNHAKPSSQVGKVPEESSSTTDLEESIGSPALEVVALHDET